VLITSPQEMAWGIASLASSPENLNRTERHESLSPSPASSFSSCAATPLLPTAPLHSPAFPSSRAMCQSSTLLAKSGQAERADTSLCQTLTILIASSPHDGYLYRPVRWSWSSGGLFVLDFLNAGGSVVCFRRVCRLRHLASLGILRRLNRDSPSSSLLVLPLISPLPFPHSSLGLPFTFPYFEPENISRVVSPFVR
jgi:hypothetical protein